MDKDLRNIQRQIKLDSENPVLYEIYAATLRRLQKTPKPITVYRARIRLGRRDNGFADDCIAISAEIAAKHMLELLADFIAEHMDWPSFNYQGEYEFLPDFNPESFLMAKNLYEIVHSDPLSRPAMENFLSHMADTHRDLYDGRWNFEIDVEELLC